MCWFWLIPDDDDLPLAIQEYFHFPGEIQSPAIINPSVRLEERDDSPIFKLDGPKKHLVRSLIQLPCSTECPLIIEPLCDVIRQIVPKEKIQFLQVYIKWRSEVITRFLFARPLVSLDCLDLDKCEIDDWAIPGAYFQDYSKIALKPDGIRNEHFVRVKYLEKVLISNELKLLLEDFDNSSMRFVRPEDMKSWWK